MYKCEVCGKEYQHINPLSRHITSVHGLQKQSYYDSYLKQGNTEGICPVCGKPTKFVSMSEGYLKHCSQKCAGMDLSTQERKIQTLRDRYGDNYQEELYQRQADTMLRNYGVKNPGQVEEFREKARKTSIERYGVECNLSSDNPKLNGTSTRIERYGSNYTFSSPAIQEKIRQSVIQKYGVDNVFQNSYIKEKSKQTNLEKYGVEFASQSQEIKDNVRETCQKKYGVDCVLQSNDIKQKIKDTNLERYGVECTLQSGSPIREKINETNLNKYGSISSFGNKDIQEKSIQTNINKYGVPYYCMTPDCRISHQGDSQPNLRFKQLLVESGLFVSDEENREFSIGLYSYDFKVGNNLIEINPTITHNITFSPYKYSQITPGYHKDKLTNAMDSGYRCICVWDWDDYQKVINQILLPKEKVFARKCVVKEVSESAAAEFINQNHMQGYSKDSIRLGLYYNDELVSIMTFGKPRYNKKYNYELIRYCSSKSVTGGAQKLFKYFVTHYNPSSIVSYCDLSKFTGDTYYKLGFALLNENINPSKHWYNIKTKRHITDNLLRQRGFDQLFSADFGKGTSNDELMKQHGFVEVFDCGQATYVWKK